MPRGEFYVGVGTTATVTFPRNGIGGSTSQRVTTNTPGAFTRNSVVLTAASLATVAPNDYIFTNNGFWGVVESADDTSKLVTLRGTWNTSTSGVVRSDVVPTGVSTVTIHSQNHLAGISLPAQTPQQTGAVNAKSRLRKIVVSTHTNAGSLTIANATGGVALLFTLPDPATNGLTGFVIDVDHAFREPWGVILTGASNGVYLYYDMDSDYDP